MSVLSQKTDMETSISVISPKADIEDIAHVGFVPLMIVSSADAHQVVSNLAAVPFLQLYVLCIERRGQLFAQPLAKPGVRPFRLPCDFRLLSLRVDSVQQAPRREWLFQPVPLYATSWLF